MLVFTEGVKTEPVYLLDWYRRHRDRVTVTIDDFHGGPRELVDAAIRRRKSDEHEARRQRGDPFDEYWCAFDVDEHPWVKEALVRAAAGHISVALSNPCIELWFLIHFRDRRASIHRHVAQREVAREIGSGKVPSPDALELMADRYTTARARAQALDAKHQGDGSPPRSNPSSNLWELVDAIRRSLPAAPRAHYPENIACPPCRHPGGRVPLSPRW